MVARFIIEVSRKVLINLKRSDNQKTQQYTVKNVLLAVAAFILLIWGGYLLGTYRSLATQTDKTKSSSTTFVKRLPESRKNEQIDRKQAVSETTSTIGNAENNEAQVSAKEQGEEETEPDPMSFPSNQQGTWYYYSLKNERVESITIQVNELRDNETDEVLLQVYSPKNAQSSDVPYKAGYNKDDRFIVTPWPGNAGETNIFWVERNEQGETVLYNGPPQSDNIASFYQTSEIAQTHKDDFLGAEGS